jgi:hypothetical protein
MFCFDRSVESLGKGMEEELTALTTETSFPQICTSKSLGGVASSALGGLFGLLNETLANDFPPNMFNDQGFLPVFDVEIVNTVHFSSSNQQLFPKQYGPF